MKNRLFLLSLISVLTLGLFSCKHNNSSTDNTLSQETSSSNNSESLDDISKYLGTNLEANLISDNYRTFYEIFVGAYSDSNNDGIGDLKGLSKRMDYLNDGNLNSGNSLGITGIWLMPIMPSPSYHKYDVKDYENIDPKYGTLEDFNELSKICDERDVKLIIDMVLNHSSSEHPWFIEATNAIKRGDLDNKYIDYYTIIHEDEKNDVQGRIFYQIGNTDYYYEGNFSPVMPELNFDNDELKEEFKDVIKFWVDLGVDGFRLDAVKYIYMGEDKKNIEFLKWFDQECKNVKEDFYLVGEDWSNEQHIIDYYEAINCFDFTFSEINGDFCSAVRKINSVTSLTRHTENYITKVKDKNEDAIVHPFLSNHDMDRVGGYMNKKTGNAYTVSNLYLLAPGNPYIYYGEEILMKGSRGTSSTDANRRLAMRWGDGDTIQNPVGSTYKEELQINGTVVSHQQDENSLLNHYKKLIQIRNAYPEIARGEYHSINSEISTFGGFYSEYNNQVVGVFHNVDNKEINIDLSKLTNINFTVLRVSVGLNNAKLEGSILTIGGQTSVILK